MSNLCTSDQAVKALGIMRTNFNGFGISESERDEFTRFARTVSPHALRAGIDALYGSEHRVTVNDLVTAVNAARRQVTAEERRAQLDQDVAERAEHRSSPETASKAVAAIERARTEGIPLSTAFEAEGIGHLAGKVNA